MHRLRLGKHQDSRENKTNCFPRDHTLSVYCNMIELLGEDSPRQRIHVHFSNLCKIVAQ